VYICSLDFGNTGCTFVVHLSLSTFEPHMFTMCISSRNNKGVPDSTFDWTLHGRRWPVQRKSVVLSGQIGGMRQHITPRAEIKKSGIPCAGNGLSVCDDISGAGFILAENNGKFITIHDADNLQALVCSCHALCAQLSLVIAVFLDYLSRVIAVFHV
jgi:hypothetical protein